MSVRVSRIVSSRLLEQIRNYGTENLYSVIVNKLVRIFFFCSSSRKLTSSAGGGSVTWLLVLVSAYTMCVQSCIRKNVAVSTNANDGRN